MRKLSLSDLQKIRPLTIQYLSWLFLFPNIVDDIDYGRIQDTLKSSTSAVSYSKSTGENSDDRKWKSNAPDSLSNLKLYTDYVYFEQILQEVDFNFEQVASADVANFLFVVTRVADFYDIDKKLSQFPFEGAFVRKV